MKSKIIWAVILIGSVLLTLAVKQELAKDKTRRDHVRIMITRRFVSSGYEQYILEHKEIPNSWLGYRFGTPALATDLGNPEMFFSNMASPLAGVDIAPNGGCENVRVWIKSVEERNKETEFNYPDPDAKEGYPSSIGIPFVWILYLERGKPYALTTDLDNVDWMPLAEFRKYLAAAFEFAQNNNIHYHPEQLEYIDTYLEKNK